jgi:cation diffusion facilitator CzcD-associated flavoprotein CzcO
VKKNIIDVAIIGAGPYGLSVAAYLKSYGVAFRIFGSPMRFWLDTPRITLKSPETASNIYTPLPNFTFVEYCRKHNVPIGPDYPMDMKVFAQYGVWAQQQLVPEVEDVQVCRLEKADDGFTLSLSSGETVQARRVVLAVGLGALKYVPSVLEHLSPAAMTHTFQHSHYPDLKGKDVTVIGAGQSAMEAAGLLHEYGAKTRMLVRDNSMVFHGKLPPSRSLWQRIMKPDSVVGPSRIGWLLEKAGIWFHYLPEKKRIELVDTLFGPFGTWWLKDRIEGKVEVLVRSHLANAREQDGKVHLTVQDDNGEREIVTDHVVAGTGYRYSVDRLTFLSPTLLSSLERIKDAPKLNRHFEASAPGLYFVGLLAAYSFGPLQRFVCGAAYAAPTVARHLSRNKQASRPVESVQHVESRRQDLAA